MSRNGRSKQGLTVVIRENGKRTVVRSPLHGNRRVVIVVNNQFTNAPNTTQIASGAGHSSASGSNAAIRSPYTRQQQSVGAGGKAKNIDWSGSKTRPYSAYGSTVKPHGHHGANDVIIVVNHQKVKLPRHSQNASATQIASGAGKFSSGGTNAAIESPGTKQQDAVGGGRGSRALNRLTSGKKTKSRTRRSKK